MPTLKCWEDVLKGAIDVLAGFSTREDDFACMEFVSQFL